MSVEAGSIEVVLKAFVDDFERDLKNAKDSLSGIADVSKTVAIASGAAFAGLTGFIGASVAAANEAKEAQIRLASALGTTAESADVAAISGLASELSRFTQFSDDAAIGAAATLASFKLNTQQITELIPKVQNLAAFMGTDLNSAAQGVASAVTRGSGAMRGLGIAMSDSQREAFDFMTTGERVAAIMGLLDQKTGDAARTLGTTAAGAFAQLKNAGGEILESFGQIFEGPIANSMKAMADRLNDIAKGISEMSPGMKNLVGITTVLATATAGLVAGLATIGVLLPTIKVGALAAGGAFGTMLKSILAMKMALIEVTAIVAALIEAVGLIKLTIQTFRDGAQSVRDKLGITDKDSVLSGAGKIASGGFSEGVSTIFGPLKEQAEKLLGSFDSIGKSAEADIVKPFGSISKTTDMWGRAMARAAEAQDKTTGKTLDFSGDDAMIRESLGDVFARVSREINPEALTKPFKDLKPKFEAVSKGFGAEIDESMSGFAVAVGTRLMNSLSSSGFINKISRSLGEFGQVMHSAMQGFSSGGVWGAVVAVVAEILSRSESFRRIGDRLSQSIGKLVEFIDPIVAAFEPIIGAITSLSELIHDISYTMGGLGSVIEALGKVLGWVADGLQKVIGGVVGAFAWIMDKIGDLFKKLHLGGAAKNMHSAADNLRKSIKQTEGDADASATLLEPKTYEDTQSDLEGLGDAASNAAEQLTNMPTGFRAELERFNASVPSIAQMGGQLDGTSRAVAQKIINIGEVTVQDTTEFMRKLKDLIEFDNFVNGGTPLTYGAPYGVERKGS